MGGLDEKVTESLLWELFVQAGPVVNVHMPKDRVTMMHQGYGFVEFLTEEDADYAIKIMNMIKLYGKPIRVNKASAHQKNLDVGANIFIGNLYTQTWVLTGAPPTVCGGGWCPGWCRCQNTFRRINMRVLYGSHFKIVINTKYLSNAVILQIIIK